ncbi:DUF6527 family protein [Conexibacter sp. DBS9H8]|uniref:DUF6527 family protein n=1 Tax=Conexibacter sp. DBS9H8 TaxID=2937801 RepID=UPI003530A6E6
MIDWWRRRGWTSPRYTKQIIAVKRSELPDLPPRRAIAIVGAPDAPQWAVLACPCGHAHLIAVNLSPKRRPTWKLRIDNGRVSLAPSVDSRWGGRRCHFWLRAGVVTWARPDHTTEGASDAGRIREPPQRT